jgi:Pyruvate kinase
MTKIVATIGPASQDLATLTFFRQHSVQIARLNFSHNSAEWHIETGRKCRAVGFELMADLAGPKILLGFLSTDKTMINTGDTVIIENKTLTTPTLTYNKTCKFCLANFILKNLPNQDNQF